jgi:hypothetical protein
MYPRDPARRDDQLRLLEPALYGELGREHAGAKALQREELARSATKRALRNLEEMKSRSATPHRE